MRSLARQAIRRSRGRSGRRSISWQNSSVLRKSCTPLASRRPGEILFVESLNADPVEPCRTTRMPAPFRGCNLPRRIRHRSSARANSHAVPVPLFLNGESGSRGSGPRIRFGDGWGAHADDREGPHVCALLDSSYCSSPRLPKILSSELPSPVPPRDWLRVVHPLLLGNRGAL